MVHDYGVGVHDFVVGVHVPLGLWMAALTHLGEVGLQK